MKYIKVSNIFLSGRKERMLNLTLTTRDGLRRMKGRSLYAKSTFFFPINENMGNPNKLLKNQIEKSKKNSINFQTYYTTIAIFYTTDKIKLIFRNVCFGAFQYHF